jgi:hypothetical protein
MGLERETVVLLLLLFIGAFCRSLSLSPVCFANHDARIWIQAPAHLDFQCSHFSLQVVAAWPRGWLERERERTTKQQQLKGTFLFSCPFILLLLFWILISVDIHSEA